MRTQDWQDALRFRRSGRLDIISHAGDILPRTISWMLQKRCVNVVFHATVFILISTTWMLLRYLHGIGKIIRILKRHYRSWLRWAISQLLLLIQVSKKKMATMFTRRELRTAILPSQQRMSFMWTRYGQVMLFSQALLIQRYAAGGQTNRNF